MHRLKKKSPASHADQLCDYLTMQIMQVTLFCSFEMAKINSCSYVEKANLL